MGQVAGYAAIVDRALYAYGESLVSAAVAFKRQVAGGSPAHRSHMLNYVRYVPLTADEASEVAECIDAPWVF